MAPSPTLPLKEKGVEFNPNKGLRPLFSQERGAGGEFERSIFYSPSPLGEGAGGEAKYHGPIPNPSPKGEGS